MNIPQKIFSIIEKLLRETKVNALDLLNQPVIKEPELHLKIVKHDSALLSKKVMTLSQSVELSVKTQEVVQKLLQAKLAQLNFDFLSPSVHDASFTFQKKSPVQSIDFSSVAEAKIAKADIQKYFQELKSKKNRQIAILPPVILTRKQELFQYSEIRENIGFIRDLTVYKRPLLQNFISKKLLLILWKKAFLQTQKTVKDLQLLGIYPGIPLHAIKNLEFEANSNQLTYSFKEKVSTVKNEINYVALFRDAKLNRLNMVVY